MCGITGIALTDRQQRPCVETLARMCAALTHRGPDSSGGLAEPGIGLAMQRLSVIDVPGGSQPVFNEDHTVAVVFNGEIYNFRELRDQLIASGHQFAAHGDTETIVHLYEEYGLDFVSHLHGMFAIAIWDFRKQQLILTRDRLGVKPLYYYADQNRFSFASEIKSLLQDATIPRTSSFVALHQLLTLGHILPPNTAFEGILELPPATTLIYQQGNFELQSWWDLSYSQPDIYNEQETHRDLMSQIRAAVARRLISDVPLGAFLSGGIDSSIVVALMSQLISEPVKTFSIGFDDAEFSELPYARQVAEHCGTDHHELIVKPDVPQIMQQLIHHHDAPFYDTSAIPTWYVSKFAREHVTVALSGDGGDEMFAGYNIYLAAKVAQRYSFVPPVIAKNVLEPLMQLIPETGTYINKGRVAREFVKGLSMSPLGRYTRWATKIKRETRSRLYCDPELRELQRMPDESLLAPWFEAQSDCSELSKLLYVGTKTELPCDMLRKVDRMSMAHSLEVRSPFLDHHLFEFASGLHDDAKLKGRTTKHALRQIARDLLPSSVVDRPKRGFSIPLDRWLREDLRDYSRQILFDPKAEQRGLFDNTFVRQLAEEHTGGKISRGRELWTLMTIELWQRSYIDKFAWELKNPGPLSLVTPMTQGA